MPKPSFSTSSDTTLLTPEQQLKALISNHFSEASERVDSVYQQHFSRPAVVFARHWRHRRDIPRDLMALPRSVMSLSRKVLKRHDAATNDPITGKSREIQHILYHELLDLPGLEHKVEVLLEQHIERYQDQLSDTDELSQQHRQQLSDYIQHQLARLHLSHEGLREGLIAFTLMISGRALGDKAILSSAASIGGTLASSAYISQQGWLAALWAGWMGVPGWVSIAGAGTGVMAALALSPLLAPGFELAMNRLRAHTLLQQTVINAEQQLLQKDSFLSASRLGLYLQILPDIAQFIQKLR